MTSHPARPLIGLHLARRGSRGRVDYLALDRENKRFQTHNKRGSGKKVNPQMSRARRAPKRERKGLRERAGGREWAGRERRGGEGEGGSVASHSLQDGGSFLPAWRSHFSPVARQGTKRGGRPAPQPVIWRHPAPAACRGGRQPREGRRRRRRRQDRSSNTSGGNNGTKGKRLS